jgi:hypothetical protein
MFGFFKIKKPLPKVNYTIMIRGYYVQYKDIYPPFSYIIKSKKLEDENKQLREQLKVAYTEVYKKL